MEASNNNQNDLRKQSSFFNYIALILACLGVILGIFFSFYSFIQIPKNDFQSLSSIDTVLNRIKDLEAANKKIELNLGNVITIAKDSSIKNSSTKLQLIQLDLEVNELKSSMQKLETLILDSPEKAVSIPLLKAEINSLDIKYEIQTRTMKDDIARVYDLNKWTIGLLATILLTSSSIFISISQVRRKKEEVKK